MNADQTSEFLQVALIAREPEGIGQPRPQPVGLPALRIVLLLRLVRVSVRVLQRIAPGQRGLWGGLYPLAKRALYLSAGCSSTGRNSPNRRRYCPPALSASQRDGLASDR